MIPHIEPSFDENEINAVSELIGSGAWLTEYTKTRELEEEIASRTIANYCYMYPNGTLALYAACKALGIDYGDEVIIPDLTMIASATAVSMTGATCVFVDVEPDTLCLSVDKVQKAITSKTKAVISVDLNGRSLDYLELRNVTDYYTYIIEDAAQAFGSLTKDYIPLGICGDIGCFSFSPHKIISTGQGGCCLTQSGTLAKRLRTFRNFGRSSNSGFEHDSQGINLKFTDLQAVIGLEQLKKIDWRIQRKKEIFARYRNQLLGYVTFLPTNLNYITPWYVDIYAEKRNELAKYLADGGIGTQSMYPNISSTGLYFHQKMYPVAKKASRNGLFLPSSITLFDEEIDYICDEIKTFMKG